MRIRGRLFALLAGIPFVLAGGLALLQARNERAQLSEELERRAIILADSLHESLETIVRSGDQRLLSKLAKRLGNRERLAGIVVYRSNGLVAAETPGVTAAMKQWFAPLNDAMRHHRSAGFFDVADGKTLHVFLSPIDGERGSLGAVLILHDAGFIRERFLHTFRVNFLRNLLFSVVIVLATFAAVRRSLLRPVSQVVEWARHLRRGDLRPSVPLPQEDILGPLAQEFAHLAKSLSAARAAAEEEARLRLSSETIWTSEKLKEHVKAKLGSQPLYLISNREPYIHMRRKNKPVECVVPPSGLVTALEPVMRACGGVWIAHGSGDADAQAVDSEGKVRVPPDDPAYTLKRVWLAPEEVQGHYYGFSNEGLWPLCHITHTRPIFRLEDWAYYQRVNERFARALLQEVRDVESPLVLIQDFHFALLPLMIRQVRPDARIALFWHIPWPNSESFGICPWKKELLAGILGADIVGFHIQYHCNNFLDTVDSVLECKINREEFSIERSGHLTKVMPFPISVGTVPAGLLDPASIVGGPALREALARKLGVRIGVLGIGVDRLDYTKGILERFKAIERFLEKNPRYLREFTFVQLGAPSRTHILKYQEFILEIERTAEKINARFESGDWKPILLLKAQHSHADIQPFYKAADLCLITSLHDGMNLVAKEFVSAREDEDGVLILSEFTGASRELGDALIINPYDVESTAESIRQAIEMPEEERRERMRRMRMIVREKNVYLWAGKLISAISKLAPAAPRAEITASAPVPGLGAEVR